MLYHYLPRCWYIFLYNLYEYELVIQLASKLWYKSLHYNWQQFHCCFSDHFRSLERDSHIHGIFSWTMHVVLNFFPVIASIIHRICKSPSISSDQLLSCLLSKRDSGNKSYSSYTVPTNKYGYVSTISRNFIDPFTFT